MTSRLLCDHFHMPALTQSLEYGQITNNVLSEVLRLGDGAGVFRFFQLLLFQMSN